MKKSLLLLSSAAAVLVLSACNQASAPAGGSASSASESALSVSSSSSSSSVASVAGMEAGSSSSHRFLDLRSSSSAASVMNNGVMIDEDLPIVTKDGSAMQPQVTAPGVVVIPVSVENFRFSPDGIRVRKGEHVTLRFSGVSGEHGVMIPDLGINVVVPHGKTVDVQIPTDKTGTFSFRCSVPCGPGHREMVGTIVIE